MNFTIVHTVFYTMLFLCPGLEIIVQGTNTDSRRKRNVEQEHIDDGGYYNELFGYSAAFVVDEVIAQYFFVAKSQ